MTVGTSSYNYLTFILLQKASRHQRQCSNFSTNRNQSAGVGTENVNHFRNASKPFQQVEKICSALMAILFLLFNAFYWPWLLTEGDFDYAKFAAQQQKNL